jgi:superfamily II DNA/RNA helicase
MWQAIVFTATKRGADDLVEELSSQGVVCAALHGDMKQSKRSRTLEQMHRGRLRVLVATDVAARGLDVKKLTHVVNFDLPRTGEDYVHRIGRTGRCGEKGTAISLVGPKDGALLAQIERFTAQKLERHIIPGFEPRTAFNLNPPGTRPKSKATPSKRRPSQSNNSERSFHGFGRSAKKPPSFKEGGMHGKR